MNIKRFLRKILQPVGIWGKLHDFRRDFYIRLDAIEFVPLWKWLKVFPHYHSSDNHINALSHSQYGQDLYIIDRIFKRCGVFVEVGGNDPINLSNTFLLEKLGWTGVAFEPINHLQEKWEKVRTTKCYPYVIGSEEGRVNFEEVQLVKEDGQSHWALSGVQGYGRIEQQNVQPHEIIVVEKQMRKLENILNELNILNIDILFVDVEGFELNVLEGIDFEKVEIRCICVESPVFTKEAYNIRFLLRTRGYKLLAHIGGDDIFIYDKNLRG